MRATAPPPLSRLDLVKGFTNLGAKQGSIVCGGAPPGRIPATSAGDKGL
jgi:hypothetical protein